MCEVPEDGSRFFQRLRPFKSFNILTGGDRRTDAASTVVVDKFSFCVSVKFTKSSKSAKVEGPGK